MELPILPHIAPSDIHPPGLLVVRAVLVRKWPRVLLTLFSSGAQSAQRLNDEIYDGDHEVHWRRAKTGHAGACCSVLCDREHT